MIYQKIRIRSEKIKTNHQNKTDMTKMLKLSEFLIAFVTILENWRKSGEKIDIIQYQVTAEHMKTIEFRTKVLDNKTWEQR